MPVQGCDISDSVYKVEDAILHGFLTIALGDFSDLVC